MKLRITKYKVIEIGLVVAVFLYLVAVFSRDWEVHSILMEMRKDVDVEILDMGLPIARTDAEFRRNLTAFKVIYTNLRNGSGELHGTMKFNQVSMLARLTVENDHIVKVRVNEFVEKFSASLPPPDVSTIDLSQLFYKAIAGKKFNGCLGVQREIQAGRQVELRRNLRNDSRAIDILTRDQLGDYLVATVKWYGQRGWQPTRVRCISEKRQLIELQRYVANGTIDEG